MKGVVVDLCAPARRGTQLSLVPHVAAVLTLVLIISVHVRKLLRNMFVSIHLLSVFKTRSTGGCLFTSIHSRFLAFNSRTPERYRPLLAWLHDRVRADG